MSPRFYLFTTVRLVNAVSVAVTVVTTLLRLINRVETCSALNRCRYSKTLLDLVFEVCAFVRSKLPANREIESVFTSCLQIQCHRTLFAPSCQPTGEIEGVSTSCLQIQCHRTLFASSCQPTEEIESVFTSCLRIHCHRTLFAPSCQPTGEIESVFTSCL